MTEDATVTSDGYGVTGKQGTSRMGDVVEILSLRAEVPGRNM